MQTHTHTHTQQWDEPHCFSKTILSQFLQATELLSGDLFISLQNTGACNTVWINIESIILNSEKVPCIHI